MNAHATIVSRAFDELAVGEAVSQSRTISARDVEIFAALSGVRGAGQAWGGFLAALLAETQLPGPGSVPVAVDLRFSAPIIIGTRVETRLTIREKCDPDLVVLDCMIRDDKGETLASGTLTVRVPAKKISLDCEEPPATRLHEHVRHDQLIARCAGLRPLLLPWCIPATRASLAAAVEAAAAGLIEPVLVGPEAKIRAAAGAAGIDIAKFRLVSAPHSHAAAPRLWPWRAAARSRR